MSLRIYVDADACPVKDEVYKVAYRYDVPVSVVANSVIRIPKHELIERIVVNDALDAADDWIAERCDAGSVVITSDIPLADRALKAGATALSPNGKAFTADSIGMALATRSIMQDLRAGAVGENLGGPAAFTKADRSKFLSALDTVLVKLKRDDAGG
ncbi:MAG: YaiI/YqxD family protein [Pseudomonadota bacterium]